VNTKKIEHIGIAVKELTEKINFYENVLGLKKLKEEIVEEQAVKIAFFQIGESKIELLEPMNEDSPIAKFIQKRGEGIHHFAILVDSIEDKIKDMQAKGAKLIGSKATRGADDMKIIFVHPKSSGGVLLELCEAIAKEEK
jgi:methylmalonyl-CoA/ethylmalonyl-CoA epimerase